MQITRNANTHNDGCFAGRKTDLFRGGRKRITVGKGIRNI